MTFDSTIVDFSGQREVFGLLGAGDASGYRAIEKAYRYAYVEIYVAGEKEILQPIDYVGEEVLSPGRYTYRLTFTPASESNRIGLELVPDP